MKIESVIDQLSLSLIQLDGVDAARLAELRDHIDKIREWAETRQDDGVVSAMDATRKLVAAMAAPGFDDLDDAIDLLTRTVSTLQMIALEGRSSRDVAFPAELAAYDLDDGAWEPTTKTSIRSQPGAGKTVADIVDDEVFAEFLARQPGVLEDMECIIMTLEKDPDDNCLDTLKRLIHTLKGEAGLLRLPDVEMMCHFLEDVLDKHPVESVIDGLFIAKDWLADVFAALTRNRGTPIDVESVVDRISASMCAALVGSAESHGKTPWKATIATLSSAPAVAASRSLKGARSDAGTDKGVIDPTIASSVDCGPPDAAHDRDESGSRQRRLRVKSLIQVDSERLDCLLDTVGELVIATSMVRQSAPAAEKSSSHARHLNNLYKITRELQETSMSLRMVPLKATFQKIARLVRDLSGRAEKLAHFRYSGEDIELDKGIADQLNDPLMHLARNAIDHGIENSDDRRHAGKPDHGLISLTAYQQGGSIFVELEDDGQGLDRDAILDQARRRGITNAGDGRNFSESDILELIMTPGFSTAKSVTDVSGRGVGMSVVKKNVESLRGRVEIRSIKGKGTTFILRLPLTLAVMDGMLIRVGAERYIIPTPSVLRFVQPLGPSISQVLNDDAMLTFEDELIPLFHLDRLLTVQEPVTSASRPLVAVVEDDARRTAFWIDDLIGQQQIVIKSMDASLGSLPGISGSAILADGQVGLILDIGGIVRLAHQN